MLKHDFVPEFDRLCRGFRYEPTIVQAEAWFERVGRTSPGVWRETVSTLLCGKHFPRLEEALDELEREAERQRKTKVQQDQTEAARTVALLQRDIQKEEDLSRIPTPGTPLFGCSKTFAGRDQVWRQLKWVGRHPDWPEAKKASERDRLLKIEATLTQEAVRLSKGIHPDDMRRLLTKYERGSDVVA